VNANFEEIKENNEKFSKELKEIEIKMQDFNIYEIFKGNSGDGGSTDIGVILAQNLEKKVFKKFEFIDEKGKRSDEEIYRLKAEIGNLKNNNENSIKNIATLKEELEKANNERKTNFEEYQQNINVFDIKFKNLQKEILEKMETKEIEASENQNKAIEDQLDSSKPDKKSGGTLLNEEDMKIIKDNQKKILEVEKNLKVFMTTANFEHLKDEIKKLNDQIVNKVNYNEFNDLRENMCNFYFLKIKNTKHILSVRKSFINYLAQITAQVVFLKDSISQLIEDRKMIDDVNWLRKKVEHLNSTVLNLKNNDDTNNSSYANKVIPMDTSKFLELNIYHEFIKSYNREIDKINRFADELKRYIDDIIAAIKSKACEKDIKNLDEYLNGKIEELKLNSNKKFADKIETGKNIKYLDTQLKHIIDVYIKKMEKGDNWLMAKKPVNGFSCASCESYIGELPDSNQYVPWNKYPIRDPNEKAYRVYIFLIYSKINKLELYSYSVYIFHNLNIYKKYIL